MRATEAKSTPQGGHPRPRPRLTPWQFVRPLVRVCDKSAKAAKHTYKFHNSWPTPSQCRRVRKAGIGGCSQDDDDDDDAASR